MFFEELILEKLKYFWEKLGKHGDLIIVGALLCLIVIQSLLTSDYVGMFLVDRGREFVFPGAILKGLDPYKDILCIYNPLAFYLNAGIFKILGEKISSLLIFGTINACVLIGFYYFLCRKFFNKTLSTVFSLFIIELCVFSRYLFKFVMPYSYSMVYGLTCLVIATYFGIKNIEDKSWKSLGAGMFFAGCAVCFKGEFLPLSFVLILSAVFLSKTAVKDILKSCALWLIMPVFTLLLMFSRGVRLNDLINAQLFFSDFATTDTMKSFLGFTGALPTLVNFKNSLIFFCLFAVIVLISYIVLRVFKKNPLMIVLCAFVMTVVAGIKFNYQFVWMPAVLFCFALFKIKDLFLNDKKLLFLIIAALSFGIRTFFSMLLAANYGIYTVVLILPAFTALTIKYCKNLKIFEIVDIKKLTIYVLCFYILAECIIKFKYFQLDFDSLQTEYGKIHIPVQFVDITYDVLKYIDEKTDKDDKILVLPEGQMINFLSGHLPDYSIHMIDNFYYEALGDKKTGELLKNADYKMIITAEHFGHMELKPFPHEITGSSVSKILEENYYLDNTISNKYRIGNDMPKYNCYLRKENH